MAHTLLQYPGVYPAEADQFPEARVDIDVVLSEFRSQGPSPLGYNLKNLGAHKDYIWQLNLKVEKRQIRILYWPYKATITILHIHKKSSPQEQQAGYAVAMKRKKTVEDILKKTSNAHGVLPTVH